MFYMVGFPHSEIPEYKRPLSAPRGLSQTSASFFGSKVPRHSPYALNCFYQDAILPSIQFSRCFSSLAAATLPPKADYVVDLTRLELVTFALQMRCSSN